MASDGPTSQFPPASAYEASYRIHVLRLPEGQFEDDLDIALQKDAKDLGIQWRYHARTGAPQMVRSIDTISSSEVSTPRSDSIDSRMSRSTGLTSHVSRRSRDSLSMVSSNNTLGVDSRSSWAFIKRESSLAQASSVDQHSIHFSLSLQRLRHPGSARLRQVPISGHDSSKRKFPRIRVLSLLYLHKHRPSSPVATVEDCPSSSRDVVGQHRSEQALHDPQPIQQAPQLHAPSRLERSPSGVFLAHAQASAVPTAVNHSRLSTLQSQMGSPSSPSSTALEVPLASQEFKRMRARQLGERQRFYRWADESNADIKGCHDDALRDLRHRQNMALADLLDQHTNAIAIAEDRQVKAEADMRQYHAKEKRDIATALKHMESYCAGSYSTGVSHNRHITDQNKAELLKSRRSRDTIDQKHANAINVLRGEQARRMGLRKQRDDSAMQEMQKQHAQEEMAFEKLFDNQRYMLYDLFLKKKQRLSARWDLEATLVLAQLARDDGIVFTGALPAVEWHTDDDLRTMWT